MQTSKINVFLSLVIFCFICGCKNSEHQQAEKPQQPIEKWKKGSVFNADSAYKYICLLYTSPSPRDGLLSRMPSSA